jgi:hypothetical protein
VKPPRFLLILFNMLLLSFISGLFDCEPRHQPRMWCLKSSVNANCCGFYPGLW